MTWNERGFSLVEVLVAMVILVIGVLALAATSSSITRMTGEGGRQGGSAAVANAKLEELRTQLCDSLPAGSAVMGRYNVAWRSNVSGVSAFLRDVQVSVGYNSPGRVRSALYATQFSCAPQAQ